MYAIRSYYVVDAHGADAHGAGYLVGGIDVAAPDGPGQSINGVVGNAHRLVGGVEGDDRQHRAENLLLRHSHGVVHAGEDAGLEIVATRGLQRALATEDQFGAFLATNGHVVGHGLALCRVDHWTHGRGGVQRIARHP